MIPSKTINELIRSEFKRVSNLYIPEESIESQWKTKELQEFLLINYGIGNDIHERVQKDKKLVPETISDLIINQSFEVYKSKYESFGDSRLLLEKQVMLQVLDVHWKEHLSEIDHLRGSIGLRAYAQKNPKNEFKQEAYSMFESMLDAIDSETIRALFSIELVSKDQLEALKQKEDKEMEMVLEKAEAPNNHEEDVVNSNIGNKNPIPSVREEIKIGRNEMIKITNGDETKEMKYKKAKPLIDTGEWRII